MRAACRSFVASPCALSAAVSDSSSSEDEAHVSSVALGGSSPLEEAAWDMLSRPAGMSLRRLAVQLLAARGGLPRDWAIVLARSARIEIFFPPRRALPPFRSSRLGKVHDEPRRHAGAMPVSCQRPHPLGSPWPVTPAQPVARVVEMCAELMAYGGAAAAWGGDIDSRYAVPAADGRREAELDRLARYVAAGASVDLVCAPSCERARRLDPSSPCHKLSVAAAIRFRAAALASAPPADSSPTSDSVSSRPHVRRVAPPAASWAAGCSACGHARFVAAMGDARLARSDSASPVEALRAAQPLALAGAGQVHVAVSEAPAAFSHRRMERMPDGECIVLPFPVCNVPPVMPFEDPVPVDPPADLVAFDVSEVIPQRELRAFQQWARRADRSLELARRGHYRSARAARPDDLRLSRSMPRFMGVTMDFSVYPFRPLMPSRWPDRPPSTDVHIRMARREFHAHADFPNRRLRGSLSHGNPEVGPCSVVSYFAAPHGSAYSHFPAWEKQMRAELDAGWGEAGFPRSFGLATYPQRCQPTSMVEQKEKFRLCHDMSWPKPEQNTGVESPNEADSMVLVVVFLVVGNICTAVAIFLAAGLPVKVAYFDLSKAYKRTGTQRSCRWRRTCWSASRSQTLDRVCFGQTDGPEAFSGQTSWHVFIIRRELAYAEQCYPSRDPAVVAFMEYRHTAVPAADVTRGGTAPASLSYVGAMIDDFGLVAVDDLLFRVDASPVVSPEGVQRTRSWLAMEVATSVVVRLGHVLEPDDLGKFWRPDLHMLYLGVRIDVTAEELVFDSDGPACKRVRYLARIELLLRDSGVMPSVLTSMAFKLLVVCECYPFGRQWLHPLFRALRGKRASRIVFASEPDVLASLQRFRDLLASTARLAVPLASRHSFPFADHEDVLVIFADASGLSRPGEASDGAPGYGAWAVRARVLYVIHGLWTAVEAYTLSISVLELLISYWAPVILLDIAPSVSHLLEFSDNSGAEWSMRRETPAAFGMQAIAERRSAFLQERRLYSRACRVASADNKWADWLSRQHLDRVLLEAQALGLTVVRLHVPPHLRNTDWLVSAVSA